MKIKLISVSLSIAVGAALTSSQAAISLTNGVAYTQNFNTLASSGSSSSLPANWTFVETGSNANSTYSAGTGSSSTADTYSFGSVAGDRALGQLRSGNLISSFGASFINSVGAGVGTIDLSISYTGEQWRLGNTGRVDRMDFQYSTNATSITTGTWTDVNGLDFTAPVTAGTLGALDGNASANKTAISSTVTSISVAPGATFWLRWVDLDASGADDGLAIDDFSITAVPEPDAALIGALGLLGLLRRRRY